MSEEPTISKVDILSKGAGRPASKNMKRVEDQGDSEDHGK
jgi:hypothetical protein